MSEEELFTEEDNNNIDPSEVASFLTEESPGVIPDDIREMLKEDTDIESAKETRVEIEPDKSFE